MSKDNTEHIFEEGVNELFKAVAALPETKKRQALSAVLKMSTAFNLVMDQSRDLLQATRTDQLTGVPNRNGLLMDLTGRLENMRRYGDKDTAVIFIDMDGFKSVNDHCGHDTGNMALILATDRLKSRFRSVDTVGRLGGDELLLLLSYEGNEKFDADAVRKKVREALEGLVFWNGADPYPVGASIGSSFMPRDVFSQNATGIEALAEEMIKLADEDMYKDKAGKFDRLGRARAAALNEPYSAISHNPSPSR